MPDREFSPLDLVIDRGIEWTDEFEVLDADGDSVDLTGHTITAVINTTDYIDGTALVAFTVTPVELTAGRFRITLTEAQTGSMSSAVEAGWFFLYYLGETTNWLRAPMYRGKVKVR